MPTINNYTFSNVSYTILENSNVSGLYPTAVITLTPNDGYVLDANTFALDTSVFYPQLQSVSFAQSGLNVTCTAVFATNFVMPPNNFSIPLCVIGEGTVKPSMVEGRVYNIVGAFVEGYAPPSNHFYTYYSNSGNLNETELVFTKTFTAEDGCYLSASIFMTEGNERNYTIESLPTYDIDGNLISITWNVYYLYPNYDAAGDEWTLKVSGSEIYVAPQLVTSYLFDTSFVYITGETRSLAIYGSPGAVFSVVMTDSLSNTYNIVTDGVIEMSGVYNAQVVFPDIYGGSANVYYEIELSGDIDPNFNQQNPISITQNVSQPTISITGFSSFGITGFTTEATTGNAFESPANLFINADWTLVSPDGDINYSGVVQTQNFKFTQSVGANPIVTTSVINSPSVQVVDAAGIEIGDRFNLTNGNINLAPFEYEVLDVVGSTISVSPNITIESGMGLFIYRTNGNLIDNVTATATVINPTTINLNFSVQVLQFGDEDITFTLDLDEVIDYVIPVVTCGSTVNSGGPGITDLTIPLDPAGGLLTFLLDGQGVADKFEIIHGNASGTKMSTSSMTPGGNYGPFDNVYGTETSNIVPTELQIATVDQFIGTNKGVVPSAQIEFTDNTGYTINNMTIGGIAYQQIIWWSYDAAAYAANPIATLRITGTAGTGWNVLRVCCPDSNCIPS